MNKVEKVSVPLPDHKRNIVFEADSTNEDDLKFKARLEAAAAQKPKNLQELVTAIANQEEQNKPNQL